MLDKLWISERMRRVTLTIHLFLVVACAFAQSDSVAVVTARWETRRISKGIVWKQHAFRGNLFNSNQNINILEVKPGRRIMLSVAGDPKVLKLTSQFGGDGGAVAALNGTFFDIKDGGSVDYVKAGGMVINDNRLKDGERAFHQKAAVLISEGRLEIEKWNGESEEWEPGLHADDIMVSGPLLVFHSQIESLDSIAFNITRHPRTAVAITSKGLILLITVDGRNENAAGMNLFELRSVMRWLSASDAINLDGGGSTTLWILGKGVVNYPSDNKLWDHEGERKVANVILVKKR